jgi:hypothetical protein
MKQFTTILFLAIPLLLVITPIAAFGIGNIRLSNGTLIPDVNRPSWMGNGTLVATTNFTCHNGNCVGGGWVPIPNNTTDDWDWKCHHSYDGAPDPDCNPWAKNNTSGPIQSNVHLQEVSIYICGHYKNGTKQWCW